MKRALKVFVISTTTELHDERLIVKKALNRLGVETFVFEIDAGALADTPQKAFLSEVQDSDLFVGLFWNPDFPDRSTHIGM